jgi:hypothetical protein
VFERLSVDRFDSDPLKAPGQLFPALSSSDDHLPEELESLSAGETPGTGPEKLNTPQSRLKWSKSSRHRTANGHWHEYFWPTVRPAVKEKIPGCKNELARLYKGLQGVSTSSRFAAPDGGFSTVFRL